MSAMQSTLYGTTSKTGGVPDLRESRPVHVADACAGTLHAPMRDATLSNACGMARQTAPESLIDMSETIDNAPRAAGPVYADDGRLVLCDSFSDMRPVPNMAWFEAGLQALLASDDYVEQWRIWDCYAQDWADVDVTLHRFEMFDLVIRKNADSVCSWRGALDTQVRIIASRDAAENAERCWQWLRVPPE